MFPIDLHYTSFKVTLKSLNGATLEIEIGPSLINEQK